MIPRRKVLPAQRQGCYAVQRLSAFWQLCSPFHASSRKYIDISLPLLLSSSSSFAKRDGRWKSISHSACMQAMMQTEAAKKKSEQVSGSASSRMIRP